MKQKWGYSLRASISNKESNTRFTPLQAKTKNSFIRPCNVLPMGDDVTQPKKFRRYRPVARTICNKYPWLTGSAFAASITSAAWWQVGDGLDYTNEYTLLLTTIGPVVGVLAGAIQEEMTPADVRRARKLARRHNLAPGESVSRRAHAAVSMSVRHRQLRNFAIVAGSLYAAALVTHVTVGPQRASPSAQKETAPVTAPLELNPPR